MRAHVCTCALTRRRWVTGRRAKHHSGMTERVHPGILLAHAVLAKSTLVTPVKRALTPTPVVGSGGFSTPQLSMNMFRRLRGLQWEEGSEEDEGEKPNPNEVLSSLRALWQTSPTPQQARAFKFEEFFYPHHRQKKTHHQPSQLRKAAQQGAAKASRPACR